MDDIKHEDIMPVVDRIYTKRPSSMLVAAMDRIKAKLSDTMDFSLMVMRGRDAHLANAEECST